MKYWEMIAEALTRAGWSWGHTSYRTRLGETIFSVDAHQGDGRRYIVHADDLLTAFMELEEQTKRVRTK